jgi:sugar/nucleoside kinase (ribokinase family)
MKKISHLGKSYCVLRPNYLRFQQDISNDLHYAGAEFNTHVSISRPGAPVSFIVRLPETDLSDCLLQKLKV